MGFYRTCPFCGDILDPGEHCGCSEEEQEKEKKWEKLMTQRRDGQYELNFVREYRIYR